MSDFDDVADVIPMYERRGRVGRTQRGGQNPEAVKKQAMMSGVRSYLPNQQKKEMLARKYRTEDFHVAVSDENGHDTKQSGRFHPVMWHEMNMVIARGNFPYDTVWDFIRVACMEHLKLTYELERTDNGVPNYIARLNAINRLALSSEKNRRFQDTLKKVDFEVGALLADNKEKQAAILVFDVIQIAKEIPEKEWRTEYLEHLKKYEWLLKKNSTTVSRRPKKSQRVTADEDDE